MFKDSFDIAVPRVDADFYSCAKNMSDIGRQMIYDQSNSPKARESLRTLPLSNITPLVLRYCRITNYEVGIAEHKDWEIEFRQNRLFMMLEDFVLGRCVEEDIKTIRIPCENSSEVSWVDVDDGFRHVAASYLSDIAGIEHSPIYLPDISSGKVKIEKVIGNIAVTNKLHKDHAYGPLISKFEFKPAQLVA